ncbi:hypothetical protein SAMN02745121_03994 [Nannocystis exedens]|uniref:Lipoprotein n=1 Tax=Nannocystis exedens TaxID=54 RepID=A0A1I1ZYN2_9BACT|nr:hypothetical protein [Nannocystis exedens]PCC75283.1 hypothetical protein NAEX_08392 [Nannocystis exedens]SFE35813.1 hypothetical protein SAMN02745121_03994 [Nannocystis exedens]
MLTAYRRSSARFGLCLAVALAGCAPSRDVTTGATDSDTGDSSGAPATTEPTTGSVEQPFSAELVGAHLESIYGCSVRTHVHLRVRVTAPDDRPIDAAMLTSVSFTDWWTSDALAVVAEDLPVAAGATAELSFYVSFDSSVVGSDCGDEALPSPPVVATFEIEGESLELTASGGLGCGFDEPPDGGCSP